MPIELPGASAIERLPWFVRALLGCCTAALAISLTYATHPLRAFPLLLAFPTVVLSSWFLGMWGGIACALTAVILVHAFLTRAQFRVFCGERQRGNAPGGVPRGVHRPGLVHTPPGRSAY
jgi:hypothetical protein